MGPSVKYISAEIPNMCYIFGNVEFQDIKYYIPIILKTKNDEFIRINDKVMSSFMPRSSPSPFPPIMCSCHFFSNELCSRFSTRSHCSTHPCCSRWILLLSVCVCSFMFQLVFPAPVGARASMCQSHSSLWSCRMNHKNHTTTKRIQHMAGGFTWHW